MIGKTISHYKILEKLGEGGMGVVYKAEDTKLRRTVALKFLAPELARDSDARQRFLHEAQAASALDHPNICTVFEADEHEGDAFIAMACVKGQSLKERIASGPLKLEEATDIAIQIAEGFQEAEEKCVIHRDIKPANVMVTPKGQVKIMDFGLAKVAGRTKLTKTGMTLGTAAYLSPEQARGEETDHRSDIWSLGVVLYEMVSGRVPFGADYEQALVYSILNESPEPLTGLRTGVPVELERIVAKALEKDPARRYQRSEDLLVDLKNLRDRMVPGGVAARASGKPHSRLLAAALALLVVVLGLLVGIRIEKGRQPPSEAAENKLAVMYFENMADDEDTGRLGEIVTNLLITDLSESRYIQIVSSQRLYDILKLLGKEGAKVIDRGLASQVAGRANAKWMLLGNILQVEPRVVLTAQLVDVAGGDVVASQRIVAEPEEEIFSLIDRLTVEIKEDLPLPLAAREEPDRPVSELTTRSAEAYRYYLEGLDCKNKHYWTEAERGFEKALECDSTLAMAYYHLAHIRVATGEPTGLIGKAVEYSHNASQKEQLFIKAQQALHSQNSDQAIEELQEIIERYPEEKEAHFELALIYQYNTGELEQAVAHYIKGIELDPLYKDAYNYLAYAYDGLGDYDKSIWAINKYISLAPDEANPYDSRGEICAGNGKIDQAIESYKKALAIKPDFDDSLIGLGSMYLFKREYAKAESSYLALCSSSDKDERSAGRYYLALIPTYQGRLGAALDVLHVGIAADRMEHAEGAYNGLKYGLKSSIHAEKGSWDLAREQAENLVAVFRRAFPADIVYGRCFYVRILAESGMLAEAELVAAEVKKDIEEKNQAAMYEYWSSVGHIEMAKGSPEIAVAHFRRAVNDDPRCQFDLSFHLAEAYLESEALGEAVDVLERALSRYSTYRARSAVLAVKAHYLLGLAYERSRWTGKAIEQYEEFLEIWKEADPGIAEVEDARQRLERLKRAS